MKKYFLIALLITSTLSYTVEQNKQLTFSVEEEKRETKNLSAEKIVELKRKHHCTIMHTIASTALFGLGIFIGWALTRRK
jgi:hypothetical protein